MLLNRKIKSSSIAEVVIALTIIALCFGVASLIFIRATNVTTRFMDVKKQTEIQSEILEHLYRQDLQTVEWNIDGVEVSKNADELNDSLQVIEFRGADDRLIWKQQCISENFSGS